MVWISTNDKEEDYKIAGSCVPELQLEAEYATTYQEHHCRLHVASRACIVRLSGIACTIGVASGEPEVIEKMIENGMNIAVLNLSRGSSDCHRAMLQNIRKATRSYSEKMRMTCPLAVGVTTRGSVVRVAFPSAEITLYEDDIIKLSTDEDCVIKENSPNTLYINFIDLHKVIKLGDEIHIDGRRVKLVCVRVEDVFVFCKVLKGGEIRTHSRVHLPGLPMRLRDLTDKDKTDIRFAVENKVDIIFPTCIRNKTQIEAIREVLGPEGKHIKIISQIENRQGIENLDEILEISDGIAIAREILAYEMEEEEVFLAQKSIIAKCNAAGKPAVCSVEMASARQPSRICAAECGDVANCVIDGADCILLNRDTAVRDRPVECVRTAASICKQAEVAVWQTKLFVELSRKMAPPALNPHAVASSAVEISSYMLASAIVVVSTSLKSARLAVQYRPRCPVVAVTRSAGHARTAHLFRGILPLVYKAERLSDWEADVMNRVYFGINFGRKAGFIRRGDPVVVMRCSRQGSGFADMMRIMYTTRRISHGSECICR